MALQTLVKLNEVRSLAEARYGAGMGVNMLGFALEKHHAHYVSPTQLQAISKWLSGVKLVGEIETSNLQVIEQLLSAYRLDYLQLNDSREIGKDLASWGVPVLIKLQLRDHDSLSSLRRRLAAYGSEVSYFLLEKVAIRDSEEGLLQSTINHLATEFPVIQSFQCIPTTWPHLSTSKLKGVAIDHTGDDLDGLVTALEQLTAASPLPLASG